MDSHNDSHKLNSWALPSLMPFRVEAELQEVIWHQRVILTHYGTGQQFSTSSNNKNKQTSPPKQRGFFLQSWTVYQQRTDSGVGLPSPRCSEVMLLMLVQGPEWGGTSLTGMPLLGRDGKRCSWWVEASFYRVGQLFFMMVSKSP